MKTIRTLVGLAFVLLLATGAAAQPWTITATAGPNGTISPSGAVVVPDLADQTFTITPNTGYHIADVLVDAVSVGAVPSYTFLAVSADHTIDASFAINTYTLTYTAGPNGTITGTSPQTVNHGSDGTLVTAVPNTGYHFVSWSDGVLTAARTDLNVTADITVTANFAINTYTLTYTAGSNGTITGTSPQTVNHGSDGTAVTAVPNTGYHFVSWSDGVLTAARTDLNVTADITVTANFAINTYTLTYTAGPNGTITGTSPQTVNHGANGTLVTAVPNTGYHFVSWSDGVLTAARTDLNVTADITVTANFAINTYTLTYTAGPNGTITGTSPQTVNHGANGTLVTAVPNTGYHFVSWSDGVLTAARTDLNVTADITVTANFAINTYTLTYTAGPNGTITGTSPQTVNHGANGTLVTAVPNTGYHFVSWSDGVLTAARTDLNVTADVTVTATFAINTYTLTYTAGPNGTITGTSPQTVNHGANGTLVTAVPNTGYHFVSWSDGVLTAARTDLNVTADITVTANFAINTYTLTYTAGPNGTITGTNPQTVNHGANGSTVTAVPNTGYHFVSWSDGVLTAARTDLNVTADITVTANFAINTYTLTYTAGPNGTISGTTPQTVDYGANGSTVTAVPNTGYHFLSWSDGVLTVARTDLNVTANISVTANFAINTYTLTYTAGLNGTISGTSPQTVNHGGNGTPVTAIPDAGFHFAGWSDGVLTAVRTDLNVTANISVTANFSLDTWTITATAGANGAIAPSGSIAVNNGADQSFTITPNANYHVADVLVDGGSVGTVTSYTFTNVTTNHTIAASFAIDTYTLTYTAGANGTISGTTPQTVNHGADGTPVTAVPNTGYHFVSWSDGVLTSSRTELNVTANISVTANFAINTYTLTYTAGPNGTISGTTPQTVNHGANGALVTAVPNTGYHFVSWSDGVLTAARTDLNVTADITVTANFSINTYTLTYTAGPNGTISGSTPQTVNHGANGTLVTAVPNTGYHFVSWSDGVLTAARTDLNVTADLTVTANFAVNTYTLTYTAGLNGTISGTSPQTVNHGSDGTTVTAVPDAGFHFAGWSDGVLTAARTDLNVTADITVTASFSLDTWSITATAGPNGTITPSGSINVNNGADQSFTIAADVNYHVADVLVDGVSVGAVTAYTFTNVTTNHSIAASFAINTFTLTYTADPNGTISGTTPQTVNYGSDGAPVTAVPNTGYHFVSWSDGVLTATRTDLNVTADITVTANFAINTYTLTYTAGLNGTITGISPQTVNHGADGTTVTAVPNAGYHFAGWSDGVLTAARTDLNVTADITVTANFSLDTWTITATAGANGTIAPSGAVTVNNGADQSFTITPDANYHVGDVLVDAVSVGAVTAYTFTSVTTNHTISATFIHDNRKPLLAAIAPQSVNEGQVLSVHVFASDSDGTVPALSAFNLPINAIFADSTTGGGLLTFSPNFTQAGVFNVSFVASDGTLADTATVSITVNNVNQAPVLAAIGPRSTTEGQILTFRVSASDVDATVPTLTTGTLPANATFTDSANGAGSFRFAPDFVQSGVYSVSFIASDGTLSDTEVVTISVANFGTNTEPTITPTPDTTVAEGGSLVLTINASDPDGGTPPELSVNTTLRNYTFVDNRNNTGTLTYTPGYVNAGLDTVRVFATDFGTPRMTSSDVFSITTTDVNQAPTWAPRGPYSLSAGQTLNVVLMAKDSTDPVTSNRLFLSILDAPLNSTFTDSANGHALFYFAPTQSQVGTDTVHFLVVDQGQPPMSTVLSVIVTVRRQNLTPIMAPIGPKTVVEGQTLSFRISATDPDGGIPVLSAAPLPSGAVFVDSLNGAGSFTWTPGFTNAGLYSVTFKATDGFATGKEAVFIQVYEAGNQRPHYDSLPTITVIEADSVTQILTASDPDGSAVTLGSIAASLPPFVTVTFNAATATVKAKPGFGTDSSYTFQLTVSDGTLADTATFNLVVLDAGNQPATLAAIGPKQVTELLSISFRVSAADADGSVPILSVAPLPSGAVFQDSLNGAGAFVWAPTEIDSGHYLLTFFAQDADSLAYVDSEQVMITVRDTNRAPLIITSGSRTMNEGQTLNYAVSAIDPDGTIPMLRARLEGVADTLATNMTFFDSTTGTGVLTFSPDYTQGRLPADPPTKGIYYVRFYAKDGGDSTLIKDATAPVQITVNNVVRPPVMNFSLGTGPFTIVEGQNLTFTVTASDPDGGSITALTASPLPANATFTGTLPTRTLNFTPNFTQAGTYNVTFTATKTGGITSQQIVTINVTDAGNQNPLFTTLLADTINCPVNIQTAIVVRAIDPDGQPVTLSASPIVINSQFVDSANGAGTYFYSPDNTDLGAISRINFVAADPLLAADTLITVLRVTAFLRGDVDNNAKYTMNDLAYLIGYLYRQGPLPNTMEAADVDRDGDINIGDITYLINFLYLNGPRPPQ